MAPKNGVKEPEINAIKASKAPLKVSFCFSVVATAVLSVSSPAPKRPSKATKAS